ncbi:MAG TPA: tripartite tricarboxylate transporter TctB family protein [Propylenella sp.]
MSNSPFGDPSLPVGEDGHPLRRSRPYWLGVGVVAIGVVWIYGALALPQTAQYARVGPGLFVLLIGAALVLLGVLLVVQIARGEQFSAQEAEDAMADAPADMPALLTAVAAAAVPLLTMRHLGFPLTAALSFALVARAFGSHRLLVDLLIGFGLGTLAYLGFAQLGVTLGGFLPLLTGR